MKTIFKSLLVIITFIISIQIAKAGDTLNPCWRLLYPHDPEHLSYNPDSVMIDTCLTTYYAYPVWFAYQWYRVVLPIGALNLPQAPRDSLILRNWRDIDTNFTELRIGFQNIENKFSPFIMRKEFPDIVDTFGYESGIYLLKFENYYNIDTLIYYLKQINGLIDAVYDLRAVQYAGSVFDANSNQIIIKIFPNPTKSELNVDLSNNKFGLQLIEIYNEINKLVYQYSYTKLIENILIKLDLSFLPNGIYFLKINNNFSKILILR